MGKKILVLGVSQNNFLSFLYGTLKKYDDSFTISAPHIKDVNATVAYDTWMYEQGEVNTKPSVFNYVVAFFASLFSKHFYQTFFFILFVEGKLKKAMHFLLKQIQGKAYFIANNNFEAFDVFHIHYMQYSYLRELFFIPKNKKIVCSFWGSDLLRTSDVLNHFFVQKALKRANVITCQSIEMREIVLSKFGRNLLDKIQITIFPIDQKIYNEIDDNELNHSIISTFKQKYHYSNDKFNMLVGHNGSPFNNHIQICQSLEKLSNKDKIHVIINLNYAITKDKKQAYKTKISTALEKTGISFTILEDFFSKEELAISRLASDIFIHMPISDALSGTMTEMLYAKNVVITGGWLPYKTFRSIGLDYEEVMDFEEVPSVLDTLIDAKKVQRANYHQNTEKISSYFFSETIIKKWVQVLN